jgi:small-conductance mechanosensitive channel
MYFFDRVFYGNTMKVWLIALIIAIISFVALEVLKKVALKHLSALGKRIKKDGYDLAVNLFRNTKVFFLLFLSLFIGSQYLTLTEKMAYLARSVMVIVFLLQAAVWGNSSISFWLESFTRRKVKEDAATVTMVSAFSYVGKILLWALLLLIALDNLGFNVRTLIAGVGIGGVAIALGVQNILKDLFASLSIATDKPFVYGDFISSGEYQGEVEQVGLKTTRLRSLTGEQIIISNSDLLQSRIRNYQRVRNRRGAFTLGVTYQTSHEKLERIPNMLREIIGKYEKTRIERVHLTAYTPSALQFEAVYWIDDPDYNLFMDTQQKIYLEIFKRFSDEGIAFAYPTQSVFVEKLPSTESK